MLNNLAIRINQRRQLRILLALFFGGLLAIALPPLGYWLVIYLCFPALYHLLRMAKTKLEFFILLYSFAFGYLGVSLYWVGHSLIVYSESLAFFAPFASLGLTAGFSLYYGFIGLGLYRLRHNRITLLIGLILGLSLADMLRQYVFTGFAFNLFGYLWADNLALSQQISLWGIEGMGIIVLLSALLPCLIENFGWKNHGKRLLLAIFLPILAYSAGEYRLQTANSGEDRIIANQPLFGIRIVQASIQQRQKWNPEIYRQNFQTQIDLSLKNRPDWINLVVWPESAIPFSLESNPSFTGLLAAASPQAGGIAVGTIRFDTTDQGQDTVKNSMALFDHQGRMIGSYDKSHLVPFGEYLPLRWLLEPLGFAKLTKGKMDYSPGTGPVTLPSQPSFVPAFTALICYEATFSRNIVAKDGTRPTWILNLTNDSWFGHTLGPWQHLAHSQMRAIEQGLPLVRSTSNGISAVYDGYGNEIAQLGLDEVGVLDFYLPPPLPITFFASYGLSLYGMMIASLALVLMIRIKKNYSQTSLLE